MKSGTIVIYGDWGIKSHWSDDARFEYHCSLYLCRPEEIDGEEPVQYVSETNSYRGLAAIKDLAYSEGVRRVTIIRDEHVETVNLHRTAKRAEMLEAEIIRKQLAHKERRNQRARQRRWTRFATSLENPEKGDISKFYRLWKKVTGYGAGRDGTLRDLLAPAKSALVKAVVNRAINEGWNVGISRDYSVRNGYDRIVYIDTPYGQVSFHVRSTEYSDLPVYAGEWSGDRGASERILSTLYEKRAA